MKSKVLLGSDMSFMGPLKCHDEKNVPELLTGCVGKYYFFLFIIYRRVIVPSDCQCAKVIKKLSNYFPIVHEPLS